MERAEENAGRQGVVVVTKGFGKLRVAEDHAKMILVGAGARFLFYPTLLYNILRNRLQPEFRWWDEIDQFLVLGAVPFPTDVPRLKSVGVDAVVTLNEPYETLVPTSLYKVQGINHLVIPTRDYLFAPSFPDINRAVQFIHEHAIRGKRTYVHCKAGRGRSTTVVICYLVEHRGMSPLEALHYVRSKRPRVLLAASQWKAVLEYSRLCKLHQRAIAGNPDSDAELDDLPVLVSSNDLVGYRGIEDAGLVGNALWKDVSLVCRLRILASSPSSAWSKLSGFWIGSPSSEARTRSCKKMAASGFCCGATMPVFQSGMVS